MNSIHELCGNVGAEINDVLTSNPVIKLILTFFSFCLCSVANIPVVVLVVPIVIVLDWLIRLLHAWKYHKIDEEIGHVTFTKVIAYAIVITAAWSLDQIMSNVFAVVPSIQMIFQGHIAITQTICTFIVFNDVIKIFITAETMGVPIPQFIIKRMQTTRNIMDF